MPAALCFAAAIAAPSFPARAADAGATDLPLAAPFTDHAVLQRGRPIPLWGRALPGERVTATLAGRTARTRADRAGRWRVDLPAMPAGGPYELSVATASGAAQTLGDVLVGDVWLCSGQSNMEFKVRQGLNVFYDIPTLASDTTRLLSVPHDADPLPLARFRSAPGWVAATAQTVPDFSAACLYMARELKKRDPAPIGLIDASWGGSAIDVWRSEAAVAAAPLDRAGDLALLRRYRTDRAGAYREHGERWAAWWATQGGAAADPRPWIDGPGADWRPLVPPASREGLADRAPEGVSGMVWYAADLTLSAEQAGSGAALNIGRVSNLDVTWVNGVAVGGAYGPDRDRTYQLPPGLLRRGRNRITVAVWDGWGGAGLTGEPGGRGLRFDTAPGVPLPIAAWRYKAVPDSAAVPVRAPWDVLEGVSTTYNGMVAPLGRYGLTGVAWYQGEGNTRKPDDYRLRLASLFADWRRQFERPGLPFLVVQLAGFGEPSARPIEAGFATVRDQQRRAVDADPHAALVVTTDIGEATDIHPANKQEVGRRLARAARSVAYGDPVAPSGARPVAAARSGDAVTVRFDRVEGALATLSGASALGFELCGPAAGSCRFVDAGVRDDRATLAGPAADATRVRFCWGRSPACNLTDASGLPVTPFELPIAAEGSR